mgnify:FL=1
MKTNKQFISYVCVSLALLVVTLSCTNEKRSNEDKENTGIIIDETLPMSQRMAESIMLRTPHLCLIDFEYPKWAYVPGQIGRAHV